jgi:hypothetical protein
VFSTKGSFMSSIRRLSGVVQAIALAAGLALVGPASHAQAPAADGSAAVKAAIESWLKGRYKVDEVRAYPDAGIWEVRPNDCSMSMRRASTRSSKAPWSG